MTREYSAENPITSQELFNLIWEGMKAQDFQRARGEGGACYYRGTGLMADQKCAWGVCIPDHLYSDYLEGTTIMGARVCEPAARGAHERVLAHYGLTFDSVQTAVARSAQDVHDNSNKPMDECLRAVAACYNLTVPE